MSTSPGHLPYDAVRSLPRLFITLGLSVAFSFVYATAAARQWALQPRSRRRPPRAEGRHRAFSLLLQQIPVFPVWVPATSLVLLFDRSLDRQPRSAQ